MSPAEALRAAHEADDEAAIRTLLADLSESDRDDLIPVAREIVATEVKKGVGGAAHLPAMLLIAYGVLPLTDIRKLGWRSNHIPKGLEDVLRGRSAERLLPIVDHLLDDVGGGWAWRVVRPLVREGIVPRPDRPSYTLALLTGTRYKGVAELIVADPALLDDEVWRLFEIEGGGENSLANYEKYTGDNWGDVFRELAATEPPMRERLLDVSLAALVRDFAQFRAGWFSRFHESLAPTDAERTQRAGAYLGLLRSPVGPTVSFAVAALGRIQRVDGLNPDDLLDRIGPVLVEGSAGTSRAALDLVGRAGVGSQDVASRAAVVASDALANDSPDVQRAAIVLIGKLIGHAEPAVAAAVARRLPEVAASQRSAAAALVTHLGGDGSVVSSTSTAAVVEPVHAEPRSASPTDAARAIEPLTTIEALMDVAVSVIETGEPIDDLERVLEAVGRLTTDRDEPFTRLTAAIAKRARTILARHETSPFSGFEARADIAAVLLAWAAGELADPDERHPYVHPGAGAFLSARAREIAEAAARGRPFLSVAAPTHRNGWIDPAEVVRRLCARPPASRLDLVSAILRLAPDGRAAALPSAAGVAGEAGAALRYAFGGREAIGATAAWWVAAARVRAPGEDDTAIEKRHPRLGPDAGRGARIRLKVDDSKPYYNGLQLELEPPLPPVGDRPLGGAGVDLPTVLMLRTPAGFYWTGRSDPAMLRWMATIQPGYREPWSAVGSAVIGSNVDWWSAAWANRVFLEPYLDPVTPIGPHALALIGIALGAKEAGERGLATDIARLALADGRMSAERLAGGLSAAAAVACDRPIRWAVSLAEVAAGSDRHGVAVAEAIARTLPVVADRPVAKLVPLLRLLDELVAGTAGASADQAREPLERLSSAGGQAGRLARSILSRG